MSRRANGAGQDSEDYDSGTDNVVQFDSDTDTEEPYYDPIEPTDVRPVLLGGADMSLTAISASCSYEGLASKMLEKMKLEVEA